MVSSLVFYALVVVLGATFVVVAVELTVAAIREARAMDDQIASAREVSVITL